MKNLTLVLVSALILAACSFDAKQDLSKRELEKRNSIGKPFAAIEGVYVGDITQEDNSKVKLQISLSYREEDVGQDPDGQPTYRPILRATMIRPDLIALNSTLKGRYEEQTGDLTMSTAKDGGSYFFLRGEILNGHYNGIIRTDAGTYGYFQLKQVSSEVPSSATDDLAQIKRIRERMKALEGYYLVEIKPDNRSDGSSAEPVYNSIITITVENAQLNGVSSDYPVLIASYEHRGDRSFAPIRSALTYRRERKPLPEVYFSNTSALIGHAFLGTWTDSARDSQGNLLPPQLSGRMTFKAYSASVRTLKFTKFTSGSAALSPENRQR